MPIIKSELRDNFTIIPNGIFEQGLSAEAVAIFCYLVSKPPTWTIRPADVKNHLSLGDHKWRKARKELVEAGYLTFEQPRDEQGRVLEGDWLLHQAPLQSSPHVENQLPVDLPHVGLPQVDLLVSGKSTPLVNTNKTLVRNKTNKTDISKSGRTDFYTDSFIRFWSVYPRKANKPDAFKAWKQVDGASIERILISDVQNRIKNDHNWIKSDGNYVPYPASYLRGEQHNNPIMSMPMTQAERQEAEIAMLGGYVEPKSKEEYDAMPRWAQMMYNDKQGKQP